MDVFSLALILCIHINFHIPMIEHGIPSAEGINVINCRMNIDWYYPNPLLNV